MDIAAVISSLGGISILLFILILFLLFVAPLAIWIHTARTSSAVREHTKILQRLCDAQERHFISQSKTGGAAMEVPKYKKCPKCGAIRSISIIECDLCGYFWQTAKTDLKDQHGET